MSLISNLNIDDFTGALDAIITGGTTLAFGIWVSLSVLYIGVSYIKSIITNKFIEKGSKEVAFVISAYDALRLIMLGVGISMFPVLKGTIKRANGIIVKAYQLSPEQNKERAKQYEKVIIDRAYYSEINDAKKDRESTLRALARNLKDPNWAPYIDESEAKAEIDEIYKERVKQAQFEKDLFKNGNLTLEEQAQAEIMESNTGWGIANAIKSVLADAIKWVLNKVRGLINYLVGLFVAYSLAIIYAFGALAFAISVFFKSAWLSWLKALLATAFTLSVLGVIDTLAGIELGGASISGADGFFLEILHPFLIILLYLSARKIGAILFNSSGMGIGGNAGGVAMATVGSALLVKKLSSMSVQQAGKQMRKIPALSPNEVGKGNGIAGDTE